MAGFTQHPSKEQMAAQQGRVAVGIEAQADGQNGWLWASGLNQREFEEEIVMKFRGHDGRYFLHTFMEFFGNRSFGVPQVDHEWYEQGRLRLGTTIDTVVSGTGTDTLTVDTTRAEPYHVVGDVLNVSGGFTVRVESVSINSGKERLTLKKNDESNFVASVDIVAGQKLGHSHNIHPEGSDAPEGRTWRPERKSNKLGIVRATSKSTGDARTSRQEVGMGPNGQKSWVWQEEAYTVEEFCRDRENMLAWSMPSQPGALINQPLGIFRDIEMNSTVYTPYHGSVTEADIQAQLRTFDITTGNEDFLVLAGTTFYHDAHNALKEYFMDGGVSYGSFGSGPEGLQVGLKLRGYSFADKEVIFKSYKGLNDEAVTGAPAGGVATAIDTDYKNFAFFLNLGDQGASRAYGTSGLPYLSYAYKSFRGINRSLVLGYLPGMTGMAGFVNNNGLQEVSGVLGQMAKGNKVATGKDSDQFFVLSQMGPRLIAADEAHGFMRSIS